MHHFYTPVQGVCTQLLCQLATSAHQCYFCWLLHVPDIEGYRYWEESDAFALSQLEEGGLNVRTQRSLLEQAWNKIDHIKVPFTAAYFATFSAAAFAATTFSAAAFAATTTFSATPTAEAPP